MAMEFLPLRTVTLPRATEREYDRWVGEMGERLDDTSVDRCELTRDIHFVKFSFGYNLVVGDDVVIHRHVLLDDRGGIRLGHRVSIADFANVYSHTHALYDGRYVDSPRTVIGDGVRVTYHATVLAGVELHTDALLGSMAVATREVRSGDVAPGIPAVAKLRKPPMADRPDPGPTQDPLADD